MRQLKDRRYDVTSVNVHFKYSTDVNDLCLLKVSGVLSGKGSLSFLTYSGSTFIRNLLKKAELNVTIFYYKVRIEIGNSMQICHKTLVAKLNIS